jgi:hypothetical protein
VQQVRRDTEKRSTDMAKMVGVWIFVHPRKVNDSATVTVGGTVIMTQQDVRKLGVGLLPISIKVMDDDPGWDDDVQDDNSFFFAAHQVGPNSFTTDLTIPHGKLEDSEPFWESATELYAKVRGNMSGLTTAWAESQRESVSFE